MNVTDAGTPRPHRSRPRPFHAIKHCLSRIIPSRSPLTRYARLHEPLNTGYGSGLRDQLQVAPDLAPLHSVAIDDVAVVVRELAEHSSQTTSESRRILGEVVAIASADAVKTVGAHGVVSERLRDRSRQSTLDTSVDGPPSTSGFDMGMTNIEVEGRVGCLNYRTDVSKTTRMHLPDRTGGKDVGFVFRVFVFLDVPTDAAKTANSTNVRQMALEIVNIVGNRPVPSGQFLSAKTAVFLQADKHKPALDIFLSNSDFLFSVQHFDRQELSAFAWTLQLANDDGRVLAPGSPSSTFGGQWMEMVDASQASAVRLQLEEMIWHERIALHS